MERDNIMKKRVLVLIVCLFMGIVSFACNVSFLVNGEAKYDKNKIYKVGQEINITVNVQFIHNPCLLDLNETKFKYDGLDVVKEGQWIENSDGTHSKLITVRIQKDYKKECKMTLIRTCTNQGGFGMLKFKHE